MSGPDPLDQTGVILLGGAHGALAAARSFGRRGIPVVLVTDDHPLPKMSRYVSRSVEWPDLPSPPDRAGWLIRLGRDNGWRNWLLVPCGDPEVRLVAEHLEILRGFFSTASSDWDTLQKVCDKQRLSRTAEAAGVAFPREFRMRSADDASTAGIEFPVVLKPAMRLTRNDFTAAKAWRINSAEEFASRFPEAAGHVGYANVIVQELIPGGGETQLSYVAFWSGGRPIAEMTARRSRQYPVEFSYSSTFVEVIDNAAAMESGRKLLASIGFEGLVEVEFKYDVRDHAYKVLDVNPRTWSWFGLCAFAGLDLANIMRDCASGSPVAVTVRPSGAVAWIHAVRDVVAAAQLIMGGDLGFSAYFGSLCQRMTFAAFAWDDPLPGLLELPMTTGRVISRRIRSRVGQLAARLKGHPGGAY